MPYLLWHLWRSRNKYGMTGQKYSESQDNDAILLSFCHAVFIMAFVEIP